MKSSPVFRTAAACAVATLALSACVVAPYPQGQVGYAQPTDITVGVAPPAPYAEVIPALPFAGALWIDGYWGWSGGRHQWVSGRYEHARPGYRWQPHQWSQGPRGNWHQRGGGWVR